MDANGNHSIEPWAHLRGIIDPLSIKIRSIDENGEILGNENIQSSLENGRIINFDYEGRVQIEVTFINYSENVGIQHTQEPLPENELKDFPDAFAMDIIKYIRENLTGDADLTKKFIELVDVDEMTLREKMDAIANGERAGFIKKWVKFQAVANVMWKYGFFNARDAEMEHDGISWGSTWNSDIENGQKSREICNTAVRRFVLLCQRVGLKAGYVPDPEGLAKKVILLSQVRYRTQWLLWSMMEVGNWWRLRSWCRRSQAKIWFKVPAGVYLKERQKRSLQAMFCGSSPITMKKSKKYDSRTQLYRNWKN